MFDAMRQSFEEILITAFFISALAYCIYRWCFYRDIRATFKEKLASSDDLSRKARRALLRAAVDAHINTRLRRWMYFFADLFWVLLFVVVVRSFLFEPFIIPSSSMKPELQIGDVIAVNKFTLGLRLPISNRRLTQGNAIKRGDVLVFKYPENPGISYIKRVIGLPGDKIFYDNRHLIINGQVVALKKIKKQSDDAKAIDLNGQTITQKRSYTVYEETLPPGYSHTMRYDDHFVADFAARDWTIAPGHYLMFGDNRDNSGDSREWGLLEDKYIIGRAVSIMLNFDCLKGAGKCDRFFKTIH